MTPISIQAYEDLTPADTADPSDLIGDVTVPVIEAWFPGLLDLDPALVALLWVDPDAACQQAFGVGHLEALRADAAFDRDGTIPPWVGEEVIDA